MRVIVSCNFSRELVLNKTLTAYTICDITLEKEGNTILIVLPQLSATTTLIKHTLNLSLIV